MIEDAIQFACRRFLDRAEGITAPGQVYAWIRTTAQRNLNREAERHHREVVVDPIENGLDRLAAEEIGPAEELIGLENDADLALLVEKISSSLTDHLDSGDYRYLTVREGMRIQDLPDELEIDTTRTSAIRQIGNAVPPTIGEVFGRAIARAVCDQPGTQVDAPRAEAGARLKAAA